MDLITLIEWCFHFSVKGRQEAGGDDRGWLYHTLKAQQIGIDASWSFWVVLGAVEVGTP